MLQQGILAKFRIRSSLCMRRIPDTPCRKMVELGLNILSRILKFQP
jgi:hypothetical protein